MAEEWLTAGYIAAGIVTVVFNGWWAQWQGKRTGAWWGIAVGVLWVILAEVIQQRIGPGEHSAPYALVAGIVSLLVVSLVLTTIIATLPTRAPVTVVVHRDPPQPQDFGAAGNPPQGQELQVVLETCTREVKHAKAHMAAQERDEAVSCLRRALRALDEANRISGGRWEAKQAELEAEIVRVRGVGDGTTDQRAQPGAGHGKRVT